MIIQKRLQKDGHVVVLAEHGGDAIRLYQADPEFDVVLMDLQCVCDSFFLLSIIPP